MAKKRKNNADPVDIICIGPEYACPYGLRQAKNTKLSKKKENAPILKSDNQGHLIYKIGDVISERYEIMSTIGKGSYGTVLEVHDRVKNDENAMKIVRNTDECHKDAVKEVQNLEKLRSLDPNAKHYCLRMYDAFCAAGHICMVLELLGPNLRTFMAKYRKAPYKLEELRHIGYQLCSAVKFLHDNGLIHNDIKPGNIALVCRDVERILNEHKSANVCCTDIRLLDFGSITTEQDLYADVAITNAYRAPERLLDIQPTYAYDVWAIGCTLFELYTGEVLFETVEGIIHLAMIEHKLGKLPIHMTCRSHLFKGGKLRLDGRTKVARDLKKNITKLTDHKITNTKDENDFFELTTGMLTIDPAQRLTMKQAVEHRFFHIDKAKIDTTYGKNYDYCVCS